MSPSGNILAWSGRAKPQILPIGPICGFSRALTATYTRSRTVVATAQHDVDSLSLRPARRDRRRCGGVDGGDFCGGDGAAGAGDRMDARRRTEDSHQRRRAMQRAAVGDDARAARDGFVAEYDA